jgi:M3 family oligoendopeptidase
VFAESFSAFENAVKEAKSAADVLAAREKFLETYVDFSTAGALANMRFTLNTRDGFYKTEKDYYDEVTPKAGDLYVKYCDYILNSPFRAELDKALNPNLIKKFEIAKKAHDPANIADEQQENAIVTEYSGLMSQMLFDYKGKKVPLTIVRGDLSAKDRDTRRQAMEAIGRGLEANADKLDEIFDRLVKIRDRQAKRMGLKNFIELGYYRMNRIDYNREMVEKFRANVVKDIVPAVAEMKAKIAERLGIDQMMLYDNDVYFATGNARPRPDAKGILQAGLEMYNEMHPEIGAFMKSMLDNEAFDVESREGKWGGGYCTAFDKYSQPFILANFNGSSDDVDVITHEFGHAYAFYHSALKKEYELNVGGMETAECHSMSMEFLCWKYMDKFFDLPEDYKYKHICDAFSFIPYGCIVDEFQHIVYENPELTPAERKSEYNKLEQKYRPYLSTKGIPYIGQGTRWQYQMHIYELPFYYIDYCLAQTVALGFLSESRRNYGKALETYIAFVKAGGTKAFSQLVKEAGIADPFGEGTLRVLADDFREIRKEFEGKISE